MGTLYIDTGGSATNSGSSDNNAADLSGTGDAVVVTTTVTLTAGTDLSGVVTSGANQSAIYLAQATNSNQKIFWITGTAGSGGATPAVTVSVAPTGITASNWAIGGRMVHTPANIESALRAGDIYQFNNSPASRTTVFLTQRASGDGTSGFIKVLGKAGGRPKLTITNTVGIIAGGSQSYWSYSNLEFEQQGASGDLMASMGAFTNFLNIKISDGGANGFVLASTAYIFASEVTGLGGDGVTIPNVAPTVFGNYIHDVGGDGIEFVNAFAVPGNIYFNIIDTCAGRGIFQSGGSLSGQTSPIVVTNNTVYGCGNSGLEINDADAAVVLTGNIFQDNGNAAGEFNVEWVAGSAEISGYHGYNVFYLSSGSNNVSGLTVNATESTADPVFTNAAGGDFTIGSSGSAYKTSFPGQFLGGSLGYLSIGSVQPNPAGAGGSIGISIVTANIMDSRQMMPY